MKTESDYYANSFVYFRLYMYVDLFLLFVFWRDDAKSVVIFILFFCGGEIICYFLLFDRNQSNQFQTTKLKICFCSVSIPKSGMATTQKSGANPSFPLQSPTHRQCGYEFSTILNSLSISFLSAS